MARNIKAKDLTGRNLLHVDRSRTIYYDRYTKKGYQLTDFDVTKYLIFNSGFAISALVLCIIYWLTDSILYSFLGLVVSFVAFELCKEFYFVRTLKEVKRFDRPEKYNYLKDLVQNEESSKLLLMGIGSVLLGLMLVFNMINGAFVGYSIAVAVVVITGSFVIGGFNLYAYFLKKHK